MVQVVLLGLLEHLVHLVTPGIVVIVDTVAQAVSVVQVALLVSLKHLDHVVILVTVE